MRNLSISLKNDKEIWELARKSQKAGRLHMTIQQLTGRALIEIALAKYCEIRNMI